MTRTYAQGQPTTRFVQVCGAASMGHARCLAIRVDSAGLTPNAPAGYHPSDLQSAYKLPSATAGSGQTVAIVDAFDDPKAESDLGVYRSTFGLAPCTTANGCFKKVNQTGGTTYPPSNSGWSEEISLDLDMVSAICPKCHILLVETNDNSFTNLGKGVNEAVKLQANEISNSYGGSEYSGETTLASYYNHPGHVITASAGDSGYGPQVPAAFNTVTAVGGTTLKRASNTRGWSETVWSGTGSGCSGFITKPSWQTDTGCKKRTISDVSADANPSTGVAVYDTFNEPGWLVFGGTSVSSPIIASVYALAGNAGSVTYGSYPYSHRTGLYDVTSGSNGSCGGSYLCTAKVGYDGPTGLGTPKGTSAF
ncbi:MAG: peptidase S8 [Ktedonobacteraceae bacterium]